MHLCCALVQILRYDAHSLLSPAHIHPSSLLFYISTTDQPYDIAPTPWYTRSSIQTDKGTGHRANKDHSLPSKHSGQFQALHCDGVSAPSMQVKWNHPSHESHWTILSLPGGSRQEHTHWSLLPVRTCVFLAAEGKGFICPFSRHFKKCCLILDSWKIISLGSWHPRCYQSPVIILR